MSAIVHALGKSRNELKVMSKSWCHHDLDCGSGAPPIHWGDRLEGFASFMLTAALVFPGSSDGYHWRSEVGVRLYAFTGVALPQTQLVLVLLGSSWRSAIGLRYFVPRHMKDIPTEELSAISAEIHEAALRVGCTHVNITGKIWPGAQASGRPEEAARFVEFSWLRAAVINGHTIFEDADPKRYAELLVRYGLEDAPSPEIVHNASEPKREEMPAAIVPTPPDKVRFTVEVLLATKSELERQAKAEGITVSELLDWKFRPRIER